MSMFKRVVNRVFFGKTAALYPIVLKALFELAYINGINKYYDYLGFYYSPNTYKMLVSWVVVVCIAVVKFFIANNRMKTMFGLFYYMNIIPTASVYWMRNESSVAFALIMLYWLVFIFAVYVMSKRCAEESGGRYREVTPESISVIGLYAITIITVVLFSYKYGQLRMFVRFEDVDLYRLAAPMNAIENYLFAWDVFLFLPILLNIHLIYKKWFCVTIDIILFLLSYGIHANKAIFFSMILVFAISFVHIMRIRKGIDDVIALFLCFYQVLSLLLLNRTNLLISLDERLLAGPAAGHFYYYDFFSSGEKLLLSESILRWLIKSPYNEKVAILIGSSSKYMTGQYNYFNNGLFSYSYANFGVIGLIIQPLFVVVTFYFLFRSISRLHVQIRDTLLALFVIYLISTTYTSWLLTGGVLIVFINSYISKRVRFNTIRLKMKG